MNVLLCTGSFPPMHCGVGDYTMHLATALARRCGLHVTVLTSTSAAGSEAPSDITVWPIISRWNVAHAFVVWRSIRRAAADIVHVQYPTQGYRNGLLPSWIPLIARLAGARVVQTWHEPVGPRSLVPRCLAQSEVVVVRANFRDLLGRWSRRLLRSRILHYVPGASALPASNLSQAEARSLRTGYLKGASRLLVFLGFVYPHKGVELLFDIGDPARDHIVVAGQVMPDARYEAVLRERASGAWEGKVTFVGFLEAARAAALLAAADAVVLPFRHGGGDWNSSIHAATVNGAYVVTTARDKQGYDAERNISYSPIDDIESMRRALECCRERRGTRPPTGDAGWDFIASRHAEIYRASSTKPVGAEVAA